MNFINSTPIYRNPYDKYKSPHYPSTRGKINKKLLRWGFTQKFFICEAFPGLVVWTILSGYLYCPHTYQQIDEVYNEYWHTANIPKGNTERDFSLMGINDEMAKGVAESV